MKKFFSALVISFLWFPAISQNQPVPQYLTQQDFPDSVLNVTLIKPDGTNLPLSQVLETYRGKKILVDIWASWCRDCIVGLPRLEELKLRAGSENVAYLFLSIDKDDAKWKSAIEKYNIRGEHYRMEGAWKTPLANYLVLDWVPRYIVIDGRGRLIFPKAIAVSDRLLEEALMPTTP
jgi:thiol-disulfide isomerase/thioredoxin